MSEPLRAADMSFAAGDVEILRDISLDVRAGEIVSLIGRNGSGKSTLCRCVVGLLRPTSGVVELSGRAASSMSARERARLVAHVPQGVPDDSRFTVREFVAMSRYAMRGELSRSDERDVIDRAMELAGVDALASREIRGLSGGERQRVMIASAAAQRAPLAVMDEPAAFLDYEHRVAAERAMEAMRGDGTSIVVVTHDVNAALRVSDRIVALSRGSIVWQGVPRELSGDMEALRAIYGVPFGRYEREDGASMLAPCDGGAAA